MQFKLSTPKNTLSLSICICGAHTRDNLLRNFFRSLTVLYMCFVNWWAYKISSLIQLLVVAIWSFLRQPRSLSTEDERTSRWLASSAKSLSGELLVRLWPGWLRFSRTRQRERWGSTMRKIIVNESKCVRLHDTVTERIIIFYDGNQGQTIW